MKKIALLVLLTIVVLNVSAQTYPPKNTPQLEFALQLRVTLGEALFVCEPEWTQSFKGIVLNVWKVK